MISTQKQMCCKKTKIVATIGPASEKEETLLALMQNGVDVIRINFSHLKEYSSVKKQIHLIRKINKENGFNTAILADLQGPKLRVGDIKEGVHLKKGDIITFTNKKVAGDEKKIYLTYEQFAKDVKVGEQILLDDGKLIFECISTNKIDEVEARVIQGGPLKSRKGVNLPNTKVSLPALTQKDKEDARFAIEEQVDWIALSFVRNATDLEGLQHLIKELSPDYNIPIISKIEKPEAIENIDEIIQQSNAIMVARGDLGVEIPLEKVPLIQKGLVEKAKIAGIPVIIATQMMESMIENLTPSRAEVNDVANSVLDGADALMLSAETSVGKYPVEVITQMSKIIKEVEDDPRISVPSHKPSIEKEETYSSDRMSHMATKLAGRAKAKAILILSDKDNRNVFQVSSHRPCGTYIVAYTNNRRHLNMLNLLWAVKAFFFDDFHNMDNLIEKMNQIAEENIPTLKKEDYIVNLYEMPSDKNKQTNTIMLSKL